MRSLAVAASLLILAGCFAVDRRIMPNPGENQFLRVENGDRLYFDLPEEKGTYWVYTVDNRDVEIMGDRREEMLAIRLRVHRGFDGPATIRFVLKREGVEVTGKAFTIVLYRRTGDVAFWK